MKTSLSFLISAMALIVSSCSDSTDYAVPAMGDYTIYEVEIGELSGICFNKERTGFLACGDKGIIKDGIIHIGMKDNAGDKSLIVHLIGEVSIEELVENVELISAF